MYSEQTPEYYCMHVSSESVKNRKIVLDRDQFRQFREGQTLPISVFRHSKVLIS